MKQRIPKNNTILIYIFFIKLSRTGVYIAENLVQVFTPVPARHSTGVYRSTQLPLSQTHTDTRRQ